MSYSINDLIEYRKQRAFETYDEALLLANENHWNAVANRLYYTSFYILTALLVKYQLDATTHIGVKAEFHKSFVKTGIVKKEHGKLFNRLFNIRQEGD